MDANSHNHNNENAISIKNLTKVYKNSVDGEDNLALDNFSLDIPKGSIYGLLGPNGAGKSTIINILAGLVIKSSGSANVWGYDIDTNMRKARSSIGIVPQEINFDPFFNPSELLELQAGLYGIRKSDRITEELLKVMSLSDKAFSYSRTLSGGMKRRLLVAKALVHRPPILVLDEPTAGVDVELRRQLWDYVKKLHNDGMTIVLTTHYLEEAEALCDKIAIINHGKLIANEDKDKLISTLDAKKLIVTPLDKIDKIPTELDKLNCEVDDHQRLIINYKTKDISVGEIIADLNAANISICDLSIEEPDLEDVFIELTSNKS